MSDLDFCHCGAKEAFENCCKPYLQGTRLPDTAEKLMRSRYSAFSTNNAVYIRDTLAPEKRKPTDLDHIQQVIDNTDWLGLKVIDSQAGQAEDLTGSVEFIAFYQESGIQQLHERSRFIKQEGRWYYLDGQFLPAIKLGRNDPCFCGSGQKFKKCHG